ncbi:MAG: hypothetical protein U9R25_14160 [Chloroflexota bacterium]|nr:hypothetical protein [Chloroflexota bacterium]
MRTIPPLLRQRWLQLIVASIIFLLPLAALPVAVSQGAQLQPLALRGQAVQRIVIRGDETGTSLYVESMGGLQRSDDDGWTFRQVGTDLPRSGLGRISFLDWHADFVEPGRLYVLIQADERIQLFQSVDGGDNWRLASTLATGTRDNPSETAPGRWHLAVAPSVAERLYLTDGVNVWGSRNGGRNWQELAPLPGASHDSPARLLTVDGQDADQVYASTNAGAMISENGGTTWQPAILPGQVTRIASLVTAFDRPGLLYAGGENQVFVSRDSGVTWFAADLPGAIGLIDHLLVDPAVGETVYALDERNQLFRTDDGGQRWQTVPTGSNQALGDLGMGSLDRSRLFLASDQGIWVLPVTSLQPAMPVLPTPIPTDTATPEPTATLTATATTPPTVEPVLPSATPSATATPLPTKTSTPTVRQSPSPPSQVTPTATHTPANLTTATPAPVPTNTRRPRPSKTPRPTNTLVPPTDTPAPPTNTAVPTDTPVPPTDTPIPPTNTPVPPTDTPVPPTNTPVPPTDTPAPPTNTPPPLATPGPR